MNVSLDQMQTAHQLRAVNRAVTRPGGESIPQAVNGPTEHLMVKVGSVWYPVFILGQNDIDSTSPQYYVV